MTNTLRMPKGWTLVGTNRSEFGKTETKQERIKREKTNFNIINHTIRLSEDALIREGKKAYEEKIINDMLLVQAYKDKKLKSKSLIKKAKKLVKKLEKQDAAKAKSATVATV